MLDRAEFASAVAQSCASVFSCAFEFGVNGGVSVGLDLSMGDGRGCGGLLWVGGKWVSMKVAASCEQDLIGVNRISLLLSAQTCPK